MNITTKFEIGDIVYKIDDKGNLIVGEIQEMTVKVDAEDCDDEGKPRPFSYVECMLMNNNSHCNVAEHELELFNNQNEVKEKLATYWREYWLKMKSVFDAKNQK